VSEWVWECVGYKGETNNTFQKWHSISSNTYRELQLLAPEKWGTWGGETEKCQGLEMFKDSTTMPAFSSLIWRKNGKEYHSDKCIMATQWGLVWNADNTEWSGMILEPEQGIMQRASLWTRRWLLMRTFWFLTWWNSCSQSLRVYCLSIVKLFLSQTGSVLNTAPLLTSRQGTNGLLPKRNNPAQTEAQALSVCDER